MDKEVSFPYNGRVNKIGDLLTKINLAGTWSAQEPLAKHTTFRVGGPAEVMVFPASEHDIQAVRGLALAEGLPLFVLGKGANLLVADAGIPGIVLNLRDFAQGRFEPGVFRAQAGLEVSRAAELGRDQGLRCLEFLYGMPSTIGGAVWMNARCYGAEIADVLLEVRVLDGQNRPLIVPFRPQEWDYKVSPFQGQPWLILEATFRTKPDAPAAITQVMETNFQDRREKGHFRAPCAGSVFKNNRDFGQPSGVIIERCGLKGLRRGGAVVSAWHANIIVNDQQASAADIRSLIEDVQTRVWEQTGWRLEEEVLYVGAWSEEPPVNLKA